MTESSDIVEMESSCSESEGDDDVEPPTLDSCVSSAPASPKVTKTKIPSPLPDNHHPPPPEVVMFLSPAISSCIFAEFREKCVVQGYISVCIVSYTVGP